MQKPPKHSRAVFILESVVPQSVCLFGDNGRVITELVMPPDKWDNLNVLLAMYNRAELYDVFSVQVSKPGMELSRSYVLEQVEYLLMNSVKKEGGKSYYYDGYTLCHNVIPSVRYNIYGITTRL